MTKMIKRLDLGLDIYEETLENGLRIYVVPMKFSQKYVTFSTNYGSIENTFIPHKEKDFVRVNDGIAHFLEHKLFEQKDGTDAFTFFTSNGAKANANTSYTKTTYLFSGVDKFNENLEYLINYVQDPYFTDENVEKEKGIIEQEIKMYDDMPWNVLFEKIMENLFINSPYKIPIIGNKKSIYALTKEDIYLCYNTFYHPSNMFIVVTGDVDPEETIKLIKENQNKKEYLLEEKIKLKEIEEPDTVCKDYEEIDMKQATPKMAIAFKVNTKEIDNRKANAYSSIFLDLLFGKSSDFHEYGVKEELFIGELGYSTFDVKSHILYFIEAETKKEKELKENVMRIISERNFNEEDFTIVKKEIIANYIRMGDNIFSINSKIMSDINKFGIILYNDIEFIESLNLEEFKDFINKIDLSNNATLIVK